MGKHEVLLGLRAFCADRGKPAAASPGKFDFTERYRFFPDHRVEQPLGRKHITEEQRLL
jgi:hypothetical protein